MYFVHWNSVESRVHKLVYLKRILEERLFYDPCYHNIASVGGLYAFADNEVRSCETMTKEWRKVTIGKFQVKMFPDSGIVSRGAINSWRIPTFVVGGSISTAAGRKIPAVTLRDLDVVVVVTKIQRARSVVHVLEIRSGRQGVCARWIVNSSLELFHHHSCIRECRPRNFPDDSRAHARLIFHSFKSPC